MRVPLLVLCGALMASSHGPLTAQTVAAHFLSEFRRPGPDGEIVAADAVGTPREIISPAIVRGGYTSFYIVVTGPPKSAFDLFIQTNPTGVLRPALFGINAPGENALMPIPKGELNSKFNEQGVAVFWLDIFTPATTPVRRIRIEAQVHHSSNWIITPLELRVQAATVPASVAPSIAPRAAGHSAAGAIALLDQVWCNRAAAKSASPPGDASKSIRAKILRNAGQDMLLLRRAVTASVAAPGIAKALGVASAAEWCAAPTHSHPDPETFLRVRDAILRASQ
ncbi:MAG: hypothetical protein FJW31_01435 [Acidobacteria bacterium]|nr:hypothetical protein [Acidobacteriota bacterium]